MFSLRLFVMSYLRDSDYRQVPLTVSCSHATLVYLPGDRPEIPRISGSVSTVETYSCLSIETKSADDDPCLGGWRRLCSPCPWPAFHDHLFKAGTQLFPLARRPSSDLLVVMRTHVASLFYIAWRYVWYTHGRGQEEVLGNHRNRFHSTWDILPR